MRQFDVCRLSQRNDQLVVLLQHDVADGLETRVVAPLSDAPYRKMIDRLRLPVDLDGSTYVLQLDRLAAVERRALGSVAGSLAVYEHRIKSALDLLLLGI